MSEAPQEQKKNALDEARMVLPGLQALFGFQLIAVFSDRFASLDGSMRLVHFASLCLVVCAVALIMTPAAYDRIAEPARDSTRFVRVSSRLLSCGMAVFAGAIASELLVVGWMVTGSWLPTILVSAVAGIALALLWFGYPLRERAGGRVASTPR